MDYERIPVTDLGIQFTKMMNMDDSKVYTKGVIFMAPFIMMSDHKVYD